jgi:hypothetical protein
VASPLFKWQTKLLHKPCMNGGGHFEQRNRSLLSIFGSRFPKLLFGRCLLPGVCFCWSCRVLLTSWFLHASLLGGGDLPVFHESQGIDHLKPAPDWLFFFKKK